MSKKSTKKQLEELEERVDIIEQKVDYEEEPAIGRTEYDEADWVCSLPAVPERTFASDVSPHRAWLIQVINKKWVNGTTLRYYFFKDGPFAGANNQIEIVRAGFKVWEDVGIGIKFQEINDLSEAEVRIGFVQGDGSWSYVGRDVIDIPGQQERTMNFGWNLAQDPRGVDTPVHEIGHTLGFPHEHQNPFAGIVWNEPAVYSYFGGPPNNWPPDRTFYNILRKLSEDEVRGSDWDPNSIMHYRIPAGLILKPEQYKNTGITPALGLSEADISQVRLFYPPLDEDQYPELVPFRSHSLQLDPAEQENLVIKPTATRTYTIQTFGRSDTVMVLFEDQNGDLKFVAGDDDSGTNLNSRIRVRLYQGRRYILRIRLYLNYATGETAVMMW